jgi:diguanylate cyclase (GGDEF)-like protein
MNWFGRTLTRKFTLLLAGFLALQALQLGVGIYGVLHIGEEGTAINEAGRQRMRMYQLLTLTHEALEFHSWPSEGRKIVDDVLADYDAESDHLDALVREMANEKFREIVTAARAHWDGELKPLLLAFDPSNPQTALPTLARFEAQVPGHVRHLDEITSLMGLDSAEDARGLAIFQAAILELTLLLGVAGFAMAHYVVTLPLRRLAEGARSIADGAYDKRIVISTHDELGELASTFNRMAAAVGEKTSRIVALNEIAVQLTSMQSLRELLDAIMRQGIMLTGAQAACIAFYDQETNRFKEWVTQGLSDHFVKSMNFRPGGMADEAFTTTTTTTVGIHILSNDRPETKHKLSKLTHEEGIQSFICLPLATHASRLGVVYFYRKDRDFFLPDEIEILNTFAHLAAGAIESTRLQEQTQNLAVTDALTGLPNRRTLDQSLAEELRRAQRYGKSLAVLLLDIDHFKKTNDTYGHQAGDAVLKALAQVFSRQVRDVDLVVRYGGEEFVFILPETDMVGSKLVAERIRRAVETELIRLPEGQEIGVTASLGIACYPLCGDTAETLLAHADQALYTAKQEGRNRVCLYREILKVLLEEKPAHIVELLKQSLENIQPIVTAMSSKGAFYQNHTRIVQQVTEQLAESLGLSQPDRESLRLASQLHDVGMIVIPDEVLNKRGPLSPQEWDLIKQHPATAADYLEQVPALRHIAPIVRHHHERYDGSGYPGGLKSDQTPYLARVLAVADAYGTMVSQWPGRTAKTVEQARAELIAGTGTQFDPQVVAAFTNTPAAK